MLYNCRCKKCRARKTLAHHPSWYTLRRYILCDNCDGVMVLDKYRTSKRERQRAIDTGLTCHCDGAFWPHTIGTIITCRHIKEIMYNRANPEIAF